MKKNRRKKIYNKNARVLTALRLARLRRGLAQGEVSKLLGISASLLSETESGLRVPNPALCSLLSAFFGVPEAELFPPKQGS